MLCVYITMTMIFPSHSACVTVMSEKAHNEMSNGLTRRLILSLSLAACKRRKNLCNDFQFQTIFRVGKAVAEWKNCMQKIVKLSIVNLTSFICAVEKACARHRRGKIFLCSMSQSCPNWLLPDLLVFEVFLGDSA